MAIQIYIDQGHNPGNPNAGAEGNGIREQDVTYRVGIELADLLRQNGAFSVRLSRPTKETSIGSTLNESLAGRVRAANSWGADAFISIHVNAADIRTATGVEGFAYSRASVGYPLGNDILTGIVQKTGLRNRGMKLRPSLYVLRRTAMPAVLVELGFITNPSDAALMRDHPDLFAEGIYNGIVRYYGV